MICKRWKCTQRMTEYSCRLSCPQQAVNLSSLLYYLKQMESRSGWILRKTHAFAAITPQVYAREVTQPCFLIRCFCSHLSWSGVRRSLQKHLRPHTDNWDWQDSLATLFPTQSQLVCPADYYCMNAISQSEASSLMMAVKARVTDGQMLMWTGGPHSATVPMMRSESGISNVEPCVSHAGCLQHIQSNKTYIKVQEEDSRTGTII